GEFGPRWAAVFALGKFGPPAAAALPLVRPLADDEDYETRSQAQEFIRAHEGDEEVIASIQPALKSADPATRRRALERLWGLRGGSPELLAAGREAITDPAPEVRALAFNILLSGWWPEAPDGTEARRAALRDPDAGIRLHAIRASGWTPELTE